MTALRFSPGGTTPTRCTPGGTARSGGRRAVDVALTALAPISWGSTYLVTTELLPPGRPLL
ncbi:EamA family transporter, partial [Micromonospora echinofusca]|nr:EamA family transporter [Micromonospora echinofusca]